MPTCPLTCPCRRAAEGAFLAAIAVFIAANARAFLGHDLGVLTATFMQTPAAASPAFLIWGATAALSVVFIITGIIKSYLKKGTYQPSARWQITGGFAVAALSKDWHFPESWGVPGSLGIQAIYVGTIAASMLNLLLFAGMKAWWGPFLATVGKAADIDFDDGRPDHELLKQQEVTLCVQAATIAAQAAAIEELKGKLSKEECTS